MLTIRPIFSTIILSSAHFSCLQIVLKEEGKAKVLRERKRTWAAGVHPHSHTQSTKLSELKAAKLVITPW